MRLIGLICVRNESWVLGCSLRAALRWCDEVVVVDHNSSDGTFEIISEVTAENPWRVHYSRWTPTEEKELTSRFEGSRTILNPNPGKTWKQAVPTEDESRWDEQDMRQHSLLLGRKHGGTHFAMIDADEILTANLLYRVREDASKLQPGEILDYPLYAMRTLDEYQDDDTHWSRGWMSIVFRDAPHLTWKPAADGYHFHSRCPWGTTKRLTPVAWKDGGVMHLQFCNRRRLVAKHVWYRMVEKVRYAERSTVQQLNEKYDDALRPPRNLTSVPVEWWSHYPRGGIQLEGWPWHEGEVRKMADKYGLGKFEGLDLKGLAT